MLQQPDIALEHARQRQQELTAGAEQARIARSPVAGHSTRRPVPNLIDRVVRAGFLLAVAKRLGAA
jgi:hypothetical protein